MQEFETLATKQEGDVLNVSLNRPRRANAVNRQLMRDLIALAEALQERDDIAFVVLRGGDKIFSAGADLKEIMQELPNSANNRTLMRSIQVLGQEVMRKLEGIEQTVIAALHGSAYGAGLAIAMTADFRVMAEGAVANLPESRIGLFLTYGCTPRLAALVGGARAKEMIMFAEDVNAAKCLDWGLVTAVVPHAEVDSSVASMLKRLRSRDRAALRVTKKLIAASNAVAFGDILSAEPDLAEGVIGLGAAQAEIQRFVAAKLG